MEFMGELILRRGSPLVVIGKSHRDRTSDKIRFLHHGSFTSVSHGQQIQLGHSLWSKDGLFTCVQQIRVFNSHDAYQCSTDLFLHHSSGEPERCFWMGLYACVSSVSLDTDRFHPLIFIIRSSRVTVVYVFGSVGVVLLNSVALMTEVILKTVNGEGLTGDMRISVFSTEFIFTLILLVFEPWIKPCLDSCQSLQSRGTGSQSQESEQNPAAGCDEAPAAGSDQKQITTESHKMNPLLNEQTQENQGSDAAEEIELNSVITQT
ncbi:uncharacterized protein LOC122331655 [Puntigrus tetrazona]|uniref:uncharacterized protein LOC122331655 n=1 Tax=Puntigrus tetrazona TaxID=1606681 RepID=UPI001C8AB76D|nr:uncharacterized protein LOC122331655 [Puntigrus tetrazona]